MSNDPLPSNSPSNQEEPIGKDFVNSADPSSPNDTSSLTSIAESVYKLLPPFSHSLKKNDQAYVDIRQNFSQVKINIHLLDAI